MWKANSMKFLHVISTQRINRLKKSSLISIRKWKKSLRPRTVIGLTLALLAGLLVAGRILQKPEQTEVVTEPEIRLVETYHIGTGPQVTVQAKVEKGNALTIYAQSPGIVQRVPVKEGQKVSRGQTLVNLSTNYQGGNAASLQRKIAAVQNLNTQETYDTQKELIGKQREMATVSQDNSQQLRDITKASLDETRTLISLNDEILRSVQENLDALESNNVNGQQDAAVLQTKQLKSQYLAGLNQLRSGLRQAEYQGANDEPAARLGQLQKDITLKQLDLQEKSLDMGKEISSLQLRLAQVSEGLMYPGAPLASTVERIHVRAGQMVSPGNPLVSLQASGQATSIVALVPRAIAQSFSKLELATLEINGEQISLPVSYISQEAVQQGLYSIRFTLPEEQSSLVSDGQVIAVHLPLGTADTSETIPFIPLDAVYQNSNNAFVFVANDNHARTRSVSLGNVYGGFVEVREGLSENDQVILDRNVIDGDPVQDKQSPME